LILESLPKVNDTNISLHPITDKAFVSSLHSDHYRLVEQVSVFIGQIWMKTLALKGFC